MRRFVKVILLQLALTLSGSAPSSANHQMVLGKLFLVKDPTSGIDPLRRRIVVVGKELAPGDGDTIVGDPTAGLGGGAFVEIVANNGPANQSEIYSMPASGWKRIPTDVSKPLVGYGYADRAPGTHGPVRRAVIKKTPTGRFVVKLILVGANGPGPQPHINIVPPDPGTDGGATLTINNGDSYCVMFGEEAGGRVLNKPPTSPHDEVFRVASILTVPTAEAGCVEVHCPISGGDSGDCCEAHDGLGCTDRECCHRVSEQEHMCGSVSWGGECVRIAAALCTTCGGTPDVCGNGVVEAGEDCDPPDGVSCASDCTRLPPTCTIGTESCCAEHDSPACADQACCEMVCESDPRCCWFGWDTTCAEEAAVLCGSCPGSACGAFVGDCCAEHGSSGCSGTSCCQTVCDLDSSCCGDEWDDACTTLAAQACSQCGAPVCPAPGGCFSTHANPGCNQTGCCEQVCTLRPSCCTTTWDATCAALSAQECFPFVGTIDIEVNATKDAIDDYLTWSPTIARIRVRDREPNSDLTVVLKNAAANGNGGRGEVLFSTYGNPPDQWPTGWPANTTATSPTITLTLPKTEAWVAFVVAGKFGKPSDGLNGLKGRDTTIEVREGAADGTLLKGHDVMVRVRKSVANMSNCVGGAQNGEKCNTAVTLAACTAGGGTCHDERERYVETLKAVEKAGKFQSLQDMHHDAFTYLLGRGAEFFDQFIHRNPAFITWHRAQLLDFERKLQAENPAVTIPYWDADTEVPEVLFKDDFMGSVGICMGGTQNGSLCNTAATLAACTTGGGTCIGKVNGVFDETKWKIKVNGTLTAVTRKVHAFKGNPTAKPTVPPSDNNSGGRQLSPSADVVKEKTYVTMRYVLEKKIHDLQHSWVGGVNFSMRTTVIDPVFFLFHCNHDRIWARWQASHPSKRAFGTDTAYSPQGVFNASKNVTKMAYLDETLWPWNNENSANGNCTNTGCGATTPPCCSNKTSRQCTTLKDATPECPAFPDGWPTTAPGGPIGMPPSPAGSKLGPGQRPKVKDVIDYEGRANPTLGLGYCYDDTPY